MDTQTRHALKQDKLVHVTQTGFDWLRERREIVVPAAIGAVVLLALLVAGLAIYSQRSTAADLAFGQAMDTYGAPLKSPDQPAVSGQKEFATSAERARAANRQFTAIANRYGMLRAGKNALYFAGLTSIELGNDATAELELQKVAASYNSDLASLAKLALANLYEQTNRGAQAAGLFKKLIANPTSVVPADSARLQLAALYETTDPAEAKRIYAQMKSDKTTVGQIAAQKLQQK